MTLTAERVRELLSYDPGTGVFLWKVDMPPRGKVGAVAGHESLGYRHISINGRTYRAHRLAWLHTYGAWPDGILDHKDRNGFNNAIENLRPASRAQNAYNSVWTKPKISKFPGITWDKARSKWKYQMMINGKKLQKRFDDEREAAEEYIFLALEHHGEFARLE